MSNIHYTQLLKSIADVYDSGKQSKVLALETDSWNGTFFQIDGQEMINFGSCGYMALEKDRRLIDRSMEYTHKYGTQWGVSRALLTANILTELEDQLSKIFDGSKVFVFTSTSLAHTSAIPVIVQSHDAVILDKQTHFSVNTATQLIPSKEVPRMMIKHNNMNMLESFILRLKDKHEKIWYLVDGVYSMYGDFPPVEQLNALMTKYEQLHIYADDAHGVVWGGKNGTGSIFDKIQYKERMVLATTMGKSFGAIGGILVFSDHILYEKVQKFGGPLSYSHPLPPPIIGAAMATTDILLSPEIYDMQEELAERTRYCHQLLKDAGLPILSDPHCPIKFIGIGDLETGFKIHRKILDSGYFLNIALFPAVSINNTGLRLSLNRHINKDQIDGLVETIKEHYFTTLKEANTEMKKVRRLFKLKKQPR